MPRTPWGEVEVLLYTFLNFSARQGGWSTPRPSPSKRHHILGSRHSVNNPRRPASSATSLREARNSQSRGCPPTYSIIWQVLRQTEIWQPQGDRISARPFRPAAFLCHSRRIGVHEQRYPPSTLLCGKRNNLTTWIAYRHVQNVPRLIKNCYKEEGNFNGDCK
jgi:hypothetical protein